MTTYIAGPMTGLPDYNYPAFQAAAAKLRAEGEDVRSPTENDDGSQGKPWDFYMRAGIRQLLECDAIYLLPGWENSTGACLEYDIAWALRMRIREAPHDEPTQADERRACANCGDEVEVGLSSREWCDGCEEEAEHNTEENA